MTSALPVTNNQLFFFKRYLCVGLVDVCNLSLMFKEACFGHVVLLYGDVIHRLTSVLCI